MELLTAVSWMPHAEADARAGRAALLAPFHEAATVVLGSKYGYSTDSCYSESGHVRFLLYGPVVQEGLLKVVVSRITLTQRI